MKYRRGKYVPLAGGLAAVAGALVLPAVPAGAGGACYTWQGQVTINIISQYWIPLVRAGNQPVFVYVQDSCFETVEFLANGKDKWMPQGYNFVNNSSLTNSGATVTFYGSHWTGKAYQRNEVPMVVVAAAPYVQPAQGAGKLQGVVRATGGTIVTMSGNLSSGADIRWNGQQRAGSYYCQLKQGPNGSYSLLNSYTPQILYSRGAATWSAVWPAENEVYTVKVTKNETLQQLPDVALLDDAKKAVIQEGSAEYLLYKYDPKGILSVNGGNPAIGYEAIQFGSEDPIMGPPWAMSNPAAC